MRISEKQKRFVREKLKGKSSRRAALDAGYSINTAKDANAEIRDKPGTQAYMKQLMEKAGITDEVIAKKLQEGTDATTLLGKDAIEYTDYRTRLDYLKYINELTGTKSKTEVDITTNGEPLQIIFSQDNNESLGSN